MNTLESTEYLIAGSRQITRNELALLSRHPDARVRRRVAENYNTPEVLLMVFLEDEDTDVRSGVANNPKATLSMLATLAEDESVDVRFELAENPMLPFTLLKLLSYDENPYVASRAQTTISRLGTLYAAVA